MSCYIIDARVAIKWIVDEPDSDRALALCRHILSAPDLLMSECANIIWTKVRLGEFAAAEAALAIRLLTRSDIDLVGARQLVDRAVELAILLDHSAYDCLYLALAEVSRQPFVTADTKLVRKLVMRHPAVPSLQTIELAGFAG